MEIHKVMHCEELEENFQMLMEKANLYQLGINETETKYMEMRGEVTGNNKYVVFKICGKEYKLERIKQFECWGTTIANTC